MQKRRIGIEGIGRFSWGEHICVFFYNKAELFKLTVPYIRAGLEDDELCMWITGDPINAEEALKALEQVLPNAADYVAEDRLLILPHSRWYLSSGVFDANRVLQNWLSKSNHAETKGLSGLRITGNPFWLRTEQDWTNFGLYEHAVTDAIRYKRILALCTYPGPICRGDHVHRVLYTHGSALFAENDRWQHLVLRP